MTTRLVAGEVHVGRRQLWPTPAGFATVVVAVLLVGATLPLDDRRPVGLLVGAALLVVADTVLALRWLGHPEVATAAPEFASTARPVELAVEVIRPAGSPVEIEVRDFRVTSRTSQSGRTTLAVLVSAPSVFHFGALRVGLGGPFGLGRCRRNVSLRARRPTHVLPPPAANVQLPLDRLRRADHDPVDVVGLREGRTGSPRRDVHWPATMRTGRLIVRERAPFDAGLIRLAVALPRTADAAKLRRVVAVARAVAAQTFDLGARVELSALATVTPPPGVTLHADLDRAASFADHAPLRFTTADRDELDRRLAGLVPGNVDAPMRPYVAVDLNGARVVEP